MSTKFEELLHIGSCCDQFVRDCLLTSVLSGDFVLVAMEAAVAARRLLTFATCSGIDLDCGRVYPRNKFVELLVDMLQSSRCLEKRPAMSTVRDALSSVSWRAHVHV